MVAKLKQLRQKRGISQMQLADAIGVSQQSVNKYENHGVEPDIHMLIKLADYFGTTVDYLIGHDIPAGSEAHCSAIQANAEEAQLVQSWRQLRSREKESIRLIMKNYLHEA